MEFVPDGTLLDNRHHCSSSWSYLHLLQVALQVATALDYMHTLQPAIAHLDVKP